MIDNILKKIGLSDGEIKIYLALLELGSTTTWGLTKKSKISGSKVYEILERLISKGLASFIIQNKVKYFKAASPEKILSYLNEKSEEIEDKKIEIQKVIPELILKQKSAKKSQAQIFIGFEGMKTATEDILNTLKRGDEWLSMGLTEQPESWEVYFNHKQKERAAKGIIQKQLLNKKYLSLYKERKKLPYTNFRFLPKELEMPTSIEIYAHKVSIFILSKDSPMVILIENEDVSNSFRKYFNLLWKSAEK